MVHLESRLPLVTITNMYVVVPPPNIQLREECLSATVHPRESVHQFSYEWQWGGVSHSNCVKFAIVLYWAEVAVLLFDEEEWECVRRFRLADIAFVEVFREKGL